MTSMMPEHTKGVFDGYSAYWRKAPEGFEKQNMMQIFEAWGADRARVEALEKVLHEAEQYIYASSPEEHTEGDWRRDVLAMFAALAAEKKP